MLMRSETPSGRQTGNGHSPLPRAVGAFVRIVPALGFAIFGLHAVATAVAAWASQHWLGGSEWLLRGICLTLVLAPVGFFGIVRPRDERVHRTLMLLRAAKAAVEEIARVDALTGAATRRALMERLEDEWNRGTRYGSELSLLMIDVDHFKTVNDRFGHQVGDRTLAAIAASIKNQLRDSDLLGRYGGEELLVVLPETSLAGASHCAERLRRALVDDVRVPAGDLLVEVTASLGVAARGPDTQSLEELVARADAAVYASKERGRNCVTVDGQF